MKTPESNDIKLVLVDDHEIFLRGLEKLLKGVSDFSLQATCVSGQELLDRLPILQVDVLILDVQLPDFEEEDLLLKIKETHPNLPILYLTMMRGNRLFRKLEKHGIGGYVIKDASIEELQNAIETVAGGGTYFSKDIDLGGEVVMNTATTPKNKLVEILSPREFEVLKLICQEYSSASIAKKLFVSTSTVDSHRKKLLMKLGVNNTVGLVKYAVKHGILEDEQ